MSAHFLSSIKDCVQKAVQPSWEQLGQKHFSKIKYWWQKKSFIALFEQVQ